MGHVIVMDITGSQCDQLTIGWLRWWHDWNDGREVIMKSPDYLYGTLM